MADVIAQTNAKIFGAVQLPNLLKILGWFLFIVILIGGLIFVYIKWRDKRLYNKKIKLLELVGDYYQPALDDSAKVIKIGSGGFEILYLKKLKTWKVAYGGRVGLHTYYFFKSPDGYWYNSMFYGKIEEIDKRDGLIPVVTANPLMRGQYTALEKQIDALHSDKKSFMEKYGTWVLAISFVLIAGFMLFLCYKEFASAMGGLRETTQLENEILGKLSQLAGNVQAIQPSGLIPAFVLFGWFRRKKKKVNPKDIPEDVLKDFEYAEERMKNSSGEEKPYRILFDIMQSKRNLNKKRVERRNIENGKTNRIDTRTNQAVDYTKPILERNPRVPERSSIQTSAYPSNKQEYGNNARTNGNFKRGFSFRRRTS